MTSPTTKTASTRLHAETLRKIDARVLARVCARLMENRTAAGHELEFLTGLLPWLREYAGDTLRWDIQILPHGGANLVGWRGADHWTGIGGVWLYSHVDTPFTGEPELDHLALGEAETLSGDVDLETVVSGHGAIVAKGPAAAALVTIVSVAQSLADANDGSPVGIMLAGGGTHRVMPVPPPAHVPIGLMQGMGRGLRAAIDVGWRPDAVINTKAGPDGVLASEPGCVIVQVQVRSEATPAAIPTGSPGSAVVAAYIALELDAWSEEFGARETRPDAEVAARAVVGCVEAGLPFKPDFQPAIGRVFIYATVPVHMEVEDVVDELRMRVIQRVADRYGPECAARLDFILLGHQDPGVTSEGALIVQVARSVWIDRFGAGSDRVRSFAGSSDGALLRSKGIDTARFGVPSREFLGGQGGAEAVRTSSLLTSAQMYATAIIDYLSVNPGTPQQPDGRRQRPGVSNPDEEAMP